MNILIVEDDKVTTMAYARMIKKNFHDMECSFSETVEKAIELVQTQSFSVILLDYWLKGGTGLEVIEYTKHIPTIFISGSEDINVVIQAMKKGAYDYIVKDDSNGHFEVLPFVITRALKQKEAETKLAISQEQYRDLFENSGDLIQSVSTDGRFIYTNPTWLRSLNYTTEEVGHLNIEDIIHKDSKDHYAEIFQAIQTGERFDDEEIHFITKDGKRIICEGSIYGKTEGDRLVAIRGVFRDITLRRKNELQYEKLVDTMNEGLITVLMDDTIQYVNPKLCEMVGYTPEELLGKDVKFALLAREKDFALVDSKTDVRSKGDSDSYELNFRHKDGQILTVKVSGRPTYNDLGEVIGSVAVITDITEIKKAEQRLFEGKRLYDLASNVGKTGVVDWKLKDDTVFIDSTLKQLIGYSENELPNDRFAWISNVYEGDRPIAIKHLSDYIKGVTDKYEHEYRMVHKNGSLRWFLARAQAIRNSEGLVSRIIGAATDITEQKQIEEKLRESQLKLETINTKLEQMVSERTKSLQESNEELRAEIDKRKKTEIALKNSEQDYRGLFENAHDAILVFNPEDEKILDVNERACSLYGFSKSEFVGLSLERISVNPDQGKKHLSLTMQREGQYTFETVQKDINDQVMFLEISASKISYKGKKVILSINRDITARKKMEGEIRVERRMRVSAVIDGQEIERKRFSQELHDGLGQLLTAAKLHIKQLAKFQTEEKAVVHVENAQQIIDSTISEVRRISHDLMPSLLQDFGLVAALEKVSGQMNLKSFIDISFFSNMEDIRLPREVEIGLYRIAQEALNNAIKYSKAENILVRLDNEIDGLSLVITDNGVGFDYNGKAHEPSISGKGLYHIKERAEHINCRLEIKTAKQKGTEIIVRYNKTDNNG